MKKRYLIFLGLFLFLFIPKNVYADGLVPDYAIIDNTYMVNTGHVTDNMVQKNLHCAFGACNFNINVSVSYEDNEYQDYPYLYLYFKSTSKEINVSRNSTCSQSCYSNSISVVRLGRTTLVDSGTTFNAYLYVLVAPVSKVYFYDNWAENRIDDIFKFTAQDNGWYSYQFVNVFISKNSNILNNSYEITDQSIDNTQSIINNNNSNTQTIINNNNANSQATQESIEDIKETITSDEIPTGNNDTANAWASKNASSSSISDMVLMPITLLTAFVNGFNSSCTPYNLGSFYGTDLVFPCIVISNYIGTTLWGVIDVLFSGLMIYAMGKKFVKIFNDFTNLRDNQIDELYGGGK